MAGSLAIDHGRNTLALDYDQRGVGYSRLIGARADIGAVEYSGVDAFGIPDAWKLDCFGAVDATNSGALDDWDKDGMNNYGEYRSGTHPTNGLSVFKFAGMSGWTPSNLVLRWSSVTGYTYMIESGTNLMTGFPLTLETNIPASLGGMNIRTVEVQNVNSVFYRIGVE
jgi:hypothetical protein